MLRFENKSVFDVRQSYFFPRRHGCSSEFHVHFFFFFLLIPSQHKTTSRMRLEPVAPKDTFSMSSRQEFSGNRTGWYGSSWMRAGRVLTAGLTPDGSPGVVESLPLMQRARVWTRENKLGYRENMQRSARAGPDLNLRPSYYEGIMPGRLGLENLNDS